MRGGNRGPVSTPEASTGGPLLSLIRLATPSDARALAALAERTFRDAFGAMNAPEDLTLHCTRSYGEGIQSAEIADPAITTLVGEQEGRLVGYLQLRRGAATPSCVVARRPLEIQRLYVTEEWHGRGVARALMDRALELAAAGGAEQVWLGVWERNPRGIAFYRKCGFVEVGETRFLVGSDSQRDLVMARAVGGTGPGG